MYISLLVLNNFCNDIKDEGFLKTCGEGTGNRRESEWVKKTEWDGEWRDERGVSGSKRRGRWGGP